MYKLDLPIDLKEQAATERRRNLEQQRQSRVFNSKVRTIGVDVQALNEQVHDHKFRLQRDQQRNEAFASDMKRTDMIAELLQKRQEQDIRNLNTALVEFRKDHQQPNAAREWDLNDPDGKSKDKPARVHDDDPRCGIASCQKFDGEDLNSKARKQLMQEQMREWTKKQKAERKLQDKRQSEADLLYDLHRREMDQRAMELNQAEEDCRRAINESVRDYNKALSDEKNEKEHLKAEEELNDNFTEIVNNINGDMLTENPDVAQSAFGPHRVITDRWKGMSPEEREQILRTQELQKQEKIRIKEDEAERSAEWELQRLTDARAGILMDREQERLRKALDREQADENRKLGADQMSHQTYLNQEVYTNIPTAQYFQQWNTSSR